MTMAQNALKRELKAQLAAQGFSVEIDRWPRKLTYYKPNGEAMPNMPADPVTMHRYINVKGFTLAPPDTVSAEFQALLDKASEEETEFLALLSEEKAAEMLKDPLFDATELVEHKTLPEANNAEHQQF